MNTTTETSKDSASSTPIPNSQFNDYQQFYQQGPNQNYTQYDEGMVPIISLLIFDYSLI